MLHRSVNLIRNLSKSAKISSSKMVNRHHIEGYEEFVNYMKKFKEPDVVYILYSGSKLPNGDSWCPDCVEAMPHIEKGIQSAPKDSHFVYVEVGDRPFWKDNKCPFRTDTKTKLNVLPTLSRWGTQKRLEGDDCSKNELLEMLITDEED
ncbi:thioredoxin domain-containing protein 17-like [Leptopilina boulardi]|uniref:thioredoxin domain-containing protein 17-like n=1 Tax=Leptopilina boulardi TaxID=63433 RepID=UPI0021F5891C|nr:thioredoxin domain-containing protein 17-like [Leptopilina boulardi]